VVLNASPFTTEAVLDGLQNTRTINLGQSSISTAAGHVPLFKSDLLPGNHTLVFSTRNLTEGAVVAIDYILYTPSFQNLQDKPIFPLVDSGPAPNPGTPDSRPDSSKSDKGAMVGGIVGGVVFSCGLIILGLWLKWRRQKKSKILEDIQTQVQEPFTQTNPSSKKGFV
jgi:hypothetical protein